jgi:hypothetical protein
MNQIKIPRSYRPRVEDVGRTHGFPSADAFATHLIDRGLLQYDLPEPIASLGARLSYVVEENGYSSVEELIEHLLERGLRAYEEPERDPAKLEARLRGLGYID